MRPTAHILTIGDELLKGSVLNTNARFLGRELMSDGLYVTAQLSCPDVLSLITQRLKESFETSDVVIVTGGLGPTPDDVTRDAAALLFDSPLVVSKKQLSFIQNYYRKRGKKMPTLVRKEAEFPKVAVPLFNHYGIALGFYVEKDGKLVVFLPGVPLELEKMYFKLVRPLIQKKFQSAPHHALIVKNVGISEPDVMLKLARDFFEEPFDFGIYPQIGEVALRLYSNSASTVQNLRRKIEKRLAGFTNAFEETTLSQVIGQKLSAAKKTVAVAESCTGGLLSSEFTKIPGSSRYFKGGIIAYNNDIKSGFLDISPAVIREKGAVSEQVAKLLADGIRRKMNATYGIGVTGIAGPEGGTASKPVGLVYLSIAGPKFVRVWKEQFGGERDQVQLKAVKKALECLWRILA